MAKKMAVRKQGKSTSRAVFWNAEKFSAVISSSKFKIAIWLLVLLMGVATVHFVLQKYSPEFGSTWPVKQVKIVGSVQKIDQTDIILLLEKTNSINMLSNDVRVLRNELKKNPWIKLATVVKQWPDTIVFELVEYQPIALWNGDLLLESGEFISGEALDKDEISIRTQQEPNPVIRVKSTTEYIHRNKNSASTLLKVVNQFATIAHQIELLGLKVAQFHVDETDSWAVELEKKKIIQLGRKMQQQRVEKFSRVYQFIDNKEALESVDLRYKNGLAVKYIESFNAELSRS